MKRRTWLVVLMLVAILGATGARSGGAQLEPSEDPDAPKHPFVVPVTVAPPAPIYPLGTASGIESDLQAGDPAPAFELQEAAGGWVRLADLRGHWAVMVFAENRRVLAPLGGIGDSLRALGVLAYGVSVDGTAALDAYAAHAGIRFGLLSDPTTQVSQLFGMYDIADDAPETGVVLIDPSGVVRLMRLDDAPQPEEVLQLARWAVQVP